MIWSSSDLFTPMHVTVCIWGLHSTDRRTVGLTIEAMDTMGYVKAKIQDKEGIPTAVRDQQFLVFAGKPLDERYNVYDYGITEESLTEVGGVFSGVCVLCFFSLVWFALLWFALLCFALVCFALRWGVLLWFVLFRFGVLWFALVCFALVCFALFFFFVFALFFSFFCLGYP